MLTLLALVFIGAGISILSKAAHGISQAIQSADWQTANGRITRSELSASAGDSRPGQSGDRSSQHRTIAYSAVIEYEFEVDGVVYQGNRVAAVKEMLGNASVAQAIVDKYPINQQVTVNYQPDKPENCLLEPGSWGGATVMIILGSCFTVFPLFLLRVAWKSG